MKTNLIFAIFIILIGFISCKKEKINQNEINNVVSYDTIKPLDYFPAFPASYWIYSNGETLKVANNYEKYIYNTGSYDGVPNYDTVFLPKLILNNIYNSPDTFAFVKEYSISKANNSSYRDRAFKGILSLNEGDEFIIGARFQEHMWRGKTIEKDISVLIGNVSYDSVIVTIQFDDACIHYGGLTAEECAILKEYYAKNIGLIKRESKHYPDSVFKTDFELVDYVIK